MIDSEEDQRLARGHLATEFSRHDLVNIEKVEKPIGWRVVYQYRKHMEARNLGDILIGPGPLLVLRSDGTIVQLRVIQSLENEMRDYAKPHG